MIVNVTSRVADVGIRKECTASFGNQFAKFLCHAFVVDWCKQAQDAAEIFPIRVSLH